MSPVPFAKIGAFLLDALRLWRGSPLTRCASGVVYAGLVLLIPNLRDFFLVFVPLGVNWLLERLKLPPLPAMPSPPWWLGLVLVVTGLLFLMFHARKKVRVREITEKDGRVTIEVEIESRDSADIERAMKLLEQRLREKADESE